MRNNPHWQPNKYSDLLRQVTIDLPCIKLVRRSPIELESRRVIKNTRLIVSVDTEEEGLWGGSYRVHGNTTDNLQGLERFQSCCDDLGVVPTYLIDAPVLEDQQAIQRLRNWWEGGRCEVGSHCHPWCTPPFSNLHTEAIHSYLCNLPEEIQYEKLTWLTNRISNTFSRRPLSYRAGRYGFDHISAKILDQLGYLVDSSVLPTFNYSLEGGPNYIDASPAPYWLTDKLLEIPITAGFTNGEFGKQVKRWNQLRSKPYTYFRAAGIADRLNLCRRLKLSPEGNSLYNLKQLADQSVREGRNNLVVMLHSSSLVPGFSPYSRTPEMLNLLYKRYRGIVQHIIEEHAAVPVTLAELHNAELRY